MKETETKTQQKTQSKGMKVLKAILNTIINIMIVLVLITSLLIAVMALSSKSSGISTVFGYTIQPIQSDSMKGGSPDGYEGGDFEKGDLMIAKATDFVNDAEYEVGDIVTYIEENDEGQQMLICHRIVETGKDASGMATYRTWGDNREVAEVPDQQLETEYLHAYDIASVYYSKDYQGTILKGWGAPLDYIKTQQGFFFVVLLPMIIFFMYAMIRVVLAATGYKKTKQREEKDEAVKAAVAAALAAKEGAGSNAEVNVSSDASPAGMSAEELEQFRQFREFQKMQKAQQEQNEPEELAAGTEEE